MTRLLLVRHGSVDAAGRCYGQRLDPALSSQGHREVTALRPRLPRLTATVRSPARRAAQSADALGLTAAAVDPRLAERDFGDWEGRAWTSIWARAPRELTTDPASYASFVPPGAESMADIHTRVLGAIQELVAAHTDPDDCVVAVTHGGPIRAVLGHALGLDPVAAMRLLPPTGSLTDLTCWDPTTWTVTSMGVTEETR